VLLFRIFHVYELCPNLPGTQARRGKLEKTGETASTQVVRLTVAYSPVASEIYSFSLLISFNTCFSTGKGVGAAAVG